jgi:hypothetical protein
VRKAVTEAVLMGIDGTGRVAPASTLARLRISSSTDGDRWDGSSGAGLDARSSPDLFFLSASPFPVSTASLRLGVTERDWGMERGWGARS